MALLPGEFSDLEPFAERWCLATEQQRWAQRMASSMEELPAQTYPPDTRGTDFVRISEPAP